MNNDSIDVRNDNCDGFKRKLIWMIVGITLVLAGAITLFFNDASVTVLDAVRSASELTAETAGELSGKAVWVEGGLHSEKRATDTYIIVSDCVVLRRYKEVYERVEEQYTDSEGNTTYSTSYEWKSDGVTRIVANDLKIGDYDISDGLSMDFEDMPRLDISGHAAFGHSVSFNYVYPSANRGTVYSPGVGDARYYYRFISNGAAGTVIARYSGNDLISFDYNGFPAGVSVYKYYFNRSISSVIAGLETSNATRLWVLRVAGTMVVFSGMLAVFLNFFAYKGISPAFQDTHIIVRIAVFTVVALMFSAAVILLANSYKTALALVGAAAGTLAALLPFIVILCMRRKPRNSDRYNRRA